MQYRRSSIPAIFFFYQVGYDLSLDAEGSYDSDLGTDKLAKYAEMFGLGDTSGLEIPEAEPHISDEYSIQSRYRTGQLTTIL